MTPLCTGYADIDRLLQIKMELGEVPTGCVPVTVFQTPAGNRTLLGEDNHGELHRFYVALPSLVFLVAGLPPHTEHLFVGVCKGAWTPTKTTHLFPFPNLLSEGSVCLGTSTNQRTPEEMVDLFFATAFTGLHLDDYVHFHFGTPHRGMKFSVKDFGKWQSYTRISPRMADTIKVESWGIRSFRLAAHLVPRPAFLAGDLVRLRTDFSLQRVEYVRSHHARGQPRYNYFLPTRVKPYREDDLVMVTPEKTPR